MTPLNVTIFIMYVRNCVMGAMPMCTHLYYASSFEKIKGSILLLACPAILLSNFYTIKIFCNHSCLGLEIYVDSSKKKAGPFFFLSELFLILELCPIDCNLVSKICKKYLSRVSCCLEY